MLCVDMHAGQLCDPPNLFNIPWLYRATICFIITQPYSSSSSPTILKHFGNDLFAHWNFQTINLTQVFPIPEYLSFVCTQPFIYCTLMRLEIISSGKNLIFLFKNYLPYYDTTFSNKNALWFFHDRTSFFSKCSIVLL